MCPDGTGSINIPGWVRVLGAGEQPSTWIWVSTAGAQFRLPCLGPQVAGRSGYGPLCGPACVLSLGGITNADSRTQPAGLSVCTDAQERALCSHGQWAGGTADSSCPSSAHLLPNLCAWKTPSFYPQPCAWRNRTNSLIFFHHLSLFVSLCLCFGTVCSLEQKILFRELNCK